MTARLAELDERLSAMRLPAPYRKLQYDARLHLQLVQTKIAAMDGLEPVKASPVNPAERDGDLPVPSRTG